MQVLAMKLTDKKKLRNVTNVAGPSKVSNKYVQFF